MKNTVLILFTLVALTSVSAQQSLNDYKYIIIPKKFDFLKEADQYKINSLTKFLFEKYNFEAILEDETFPSDYGKNNCLGLKADVLKDSNMFKTKLSVQLRNCKNELIFTSAQGESREKNYKVAYNQALRSAFKSIEKTNYSYNPENAITANDAVEVIQEEQKEIEKLKDEIKVLKNEKVVVVENAPKVLLIKTKEKQEEDTQEILEFNNSRLIAEAIPKSGLTYNLLNSNGDKIYTILFSGKTDLYIVKDRDAIIYKLNGKWVIAEAKGNDLKLMALDIKF
ncbi:hypothetical protein [Lacinutrix jangbogonensis]|uniref:hypothetical protein n=1 Tax=Lacinutrix jangbogonensis TaxID=1469557 RepID=UPI00068EB351|nr:hypothetical protein [Lacinutrix jangbogonensis]